MQCRCSRDVWQEFLNDEQGGGTIMGLLWFVLLVGVTGMAVDVTDGFRSRTMLQATADAAALAGVIDLPDETAAVATAVAYANSNMAADEYGTVLIDADVDIGAWDPATHIFSTGAAVPDAVRVRTRRSVDNQNPLPVNFLRIIGLHNWNVTTYAIAQRFIPDCLRDGLVARGLVDISSNNGFVNQICIHGQQGVAMQNSNYYESGVTVSMPDLDNDLILPAVGMESNPGLPEALREQSLDPRMVNHVSEIMDDILALEPYVIPGYIPLGDGGGGCTWGVGCGGTTGVTVQIRDNKWNFNDAASGNVYHIQCAPNKSVGIPNNKVLDRMVIVSDCQVSVGSGVTLTNVILASRAGGNPGNGNGNGGTVSGGGGPGVSNANISFSANVNLGAADNCQPGGGVQIFTDASVHFSSTMTINGVQVVAAGDVDLGARDQGINGINVQTGGHITLTANNMFGLCSGGAPDLQTVSYYRLVY